MSIEDKEAEIIQKEARKDDQDELGLSDDIHTARINHDVAARKSKDYNPFDDDEVLDVLSEKDDKIRELDEQVQELAKYVNTSQVENHPAYKRLQERNDQLIHDNVELTETIKEYIANEPKSTFKPATAYQGSVGQ
jgi:seryl-tRNA synthetase